VSARDDWLASAYDALRDAGHRSGGASEAVIELLAREGRALTAQEIIDRARSSTRPVAPASVYRALVTLADLRLVRGLDLGQGVASWELVLPAGEHHHWVVCTGCGTTESFSDARLENALAEVEAGVAFDVFSHDVVLHGLCPPCASGARSRRPGTSRAAARRGRRS
jgi:Fe2+ or Zn2+ uptake regulation protein